MEKHTSYCGMMRLGFPVPETWVVPPKSYVESPDLQPTLSRYARLFKLEDIAEKIGYPMFMKPYDGGAWVGVTSIRDSESLHKAYNESGTRLMHLQKGIIPHEKFVRCVGLGPQWRFVNYDPAAPLHDRYRMETDFLSDDDMTTLSQHDNGHQCVLRLGFQLLRGTARRWHLVPNRFRECLPRFAGHIAAFPLPVAHQG
jgi:hypothetical protein